jgi:RNA polymerase sigma-70 factor (ECF subfamily)
MAAETVLGATLLADDAPRSSRVADLFEAHHQTVYRLARRLAASSEDAADLVQETFLRAARDPRRIPAGRDDQEAWLVRVAVNLRRDQWRRQRVRRQSAAMLQADAVTPPSQASAAEARAEIWMALDRLHPRRRAAVVLAELDGMSVARIASLLGITAVTVRWHLSRGRRDLRRILRAHLGGSDDHGR